MIINSQGVFNNQLHTAWLTILYTVELTTPLRMRIASDFVSSPAPEPCGTLTYGQVEDYTVIVTGNVGLQDTEQVKLKIYPNPTSDILNLSEKVNNIEIYSTDGRKVMSIDSADKINVSALSKGNYLIKKAKNSTNIKAQGAFIKK